MTAQHSSGVKLGFEDASMRIPLSCIRPLREVPDKVRNSMKYRQIAASISEVGIIEPPVVARDATEREIYHLLDGHLRLNILRAKGEAEVVCLIATDDEAFTYNKRISRIVIVQEHKMILNAIRKGVSEERLAKALNVDITNIRMKRNLLVGICPEVAEMLSNRRVPINVFHELRRMRPVRQIEAVEAMIAMNQFTLAYAQSLVASTPEDLLIQGARNKPKGLSANQIEVMQRESENLDREFHSIEANYGKDHLDLVLAIGYLSKLLANARVVGFLAQHHAGILSEFQKSIDLQRAA